MSLKISDFEVYRELLYAKSGLTLTPDKSYLLESRLTPIAKKWGYPTLEAMALALRAVPDQKLVGDIVEAMTTNETSFYRDTKPFQIFEKEVLPHLLKTRTVTKRIRIWCAAASSGQEPYSLAMQLLEKKALWAGLNIDIVATDISHDILNIARAATYTQFEVQRGLPITHLMKYFTQNGDKWTLKDEVKKMVRFDYFNLLDPMARLGTFDVIFCRNVLIYFDEKTKAQVLDAMAKQLPADGFLFLGGAETVLGISQKFAPMPNQRGLYVTANHPALGATAPIGTPGTLKTV